MRSALFLLILLTLSLCHAQSQAPTVKFYNFTLDQGLSMNFITCINQDKEGFIWVGTADGLNKYDGYKYTVYRNSPGVACSISDNSILTIHVGKQGTLYVGTEHGGLTIYDREKNCFTTYQHDPANPESISANRVTSIHEDRNGLVWVGTEKKGLNLFDAHTKTFTHYNHNIKDDNNVASDGIRALAEDKNGNLWVGTERGVSVLSADRKIWKHYKHLPANPKSIGPNAIRKIFIDRDDNVWVGNIRGGLNLFDRGHESFKKFRSYNSPDSLLGDYVVDICEDQNGAILVATNFGLSILDKKRNVFHNYNHDPFDENSLIDNGLNAVFTDRDGNTWIGSIVGLSMKGFLPPKFEHVVRNLGKPQSLGSKEVFCFYQDSQDHIWIGLRNGFDLYNRADHTFKHFVKFPDGQSIPTITSIYRDKEGVFWLGMYEGIARYDLDKNKCQLFTHANPHDMKSTPIRDVWYIQEDADGDLYISSFVKSVMRYNRKENLFNVLVWEGKGLEQIDPTCFYIDKQNNFWLGSGQDGLVKFNIKKNIYQVFKHEINNTKSISNNHILTLYEDGKGNFWVGTKGGLNLMDNKTNTFTRYQINDGLSNEQVNAIQEDAAGKLWVSTNNGLSTFDPVKKTFKNFDSDDDLQNNEFWHRASCKLRSGEILFGGLNGFNVVDPTKIVFNTKVPPVYITDFQIFNKTVSIDTANSPLKKNIEQTTHLTLSYKESVFSFEFVALNYLASTKNKYAYTMEGFDKSWNYVDGQRKATYTNLDPGKYTFKVKASNNDGVWNEVGKSLTLVITPPFWRTTWFTLTTLVLVLSIIYFAYRVKTNQIKHENKRLEGRVLERTHEIELQKQEILKNRDELEQLNLEISNQNEALEKRVEDRTLDLRVTNEELAANQEELIQTLDHTLEINEKLTESQAILAEAQRIAKLGIWELDVKTYHYTWSEETYRIFGHVATEAAPGYEEVLHKISYEYRTTFIRLIQEAIDDGKLFEIELQIISEQAQKGLSWVLIIGKPVWNVQGQLVKLIGIIIDNTERRLAEEQLKEQNHELRKINVELDRFVYSASHDLRAPLSSLLGLINIAKLEPYEEIKSRYFGMMEKSIHKMDTFIQSIISYSKNARLELTIQPIYFQELFDETFDNLKYMDQSEHIDKKLTVNSKAAFHSDLFRLKIIFNNIISNCIRYSDPNKDSFIDIRIVTDEWKTHIEFEDNGNGISEENIDNVFKMFYRASETNVGSGLGLYIVKEVVQALNGTVKVISKLKKGTTFIIELPNLEPGKF